MQGKDGKTAVPDNESISRYEVRCPRCDVSFPVGTRRCIHCGGRTGPSAAGPSRASGTSFALRPMGTAASSAAGVQPPAAGEGIRFGPSGISSGSAGAESLAVVDDDDEQESAAARPSVLRAVSTLVWVALALALSLSRSCSG